MLAPDNSSSPSRPVRLHNFMIYPVREQPSNPPSLANSHLCQPVDQRAGIEARKSSDTMLCFRSIAALEHEHFRRSV
jgi:hypothetical protein